MIDVNSSSVLSALSVCVDHSRSADVRRSDQLDTHPPFIAEGGYYREEAIMLLRRFYMSENQNGASTSASASASTSLHPCIMLHG